MIIRTFRSSDLDRILDFKRESAMVSFPNKRVSLAKFKQDVMNAEKGSILVAEENNKIVGYIFLKTKKTNTGFYGVINHIFVEKSHRGKGIAVTLMKKAEDYFKSKGVKTIRSTITLTNTPSLALAKKLGYIEKRVIMEKKLK